MSSAARRGRVSHEYAGSADEADLSFQRSELLEILLEVVLVHKITSTFCERKVVWIQPLAFLVRDEVSVDREEQRVEISRKKW